MVDWSQLNKLPQLRISAADRGKYAGYALLILVPLLAVYLYPEQDLEKDGARHFAYLHSIVFDHDFEFENEYQAIWPSFRNRPWYLETTGEVPNESPIGPALFWLPAYLLVVGLRIDPSGVGWASQAAAVFMSALAFSLGVLLAYRLLLKYTGRGGAIAAHHSENNKDNGAEIDSQGPAGSAVEWLGYPLLSVAIVTVGSFFLYWWLFQGLYGHALAVGVCTAFVWYWDRVFDSDKPSQWIILGAVGGLVTLVRWQNLVLPLLAALIKAAYSKDRSRAALGLLSFAATLAFVFSPQLLVWKSIYGSWLTIPQDTFFHWDKPYLIDMLFSPRYGFLSFSPVMILAVAGLVAGAAWKREPLFLLGTVFLLVSIYVNACAGDWYAGATFGPRRLDGLFVFFVFGTSLSLCAILRWIRHRPETVLAVMFAAAALFTGIMLKGFQQRQYNVGMALAHEFPRRSWEVVLDTVGWPPSLPAELYYMARDGTRLGQYSAIALDEAVLYRRDRPLSIEERNLGDGWQLTGDGASLVEEWGTLFIYLMDLGFHYHDLEVGFVMPNRQQLEVRVNGVDSTVGVVRRERGNTGRWVYRVPVDYRVLRAGINRLEVRGVDLTVAELEVERRE
jgi:hypothetical protein